jgi:peptide/nickel transport system substrate-binding protein
MKRKEGTGMSDRLNDLLDLLAKGKITRRGFLTQVTAMGLLFSISPSFLRGEAHALTPMRGGRLKIGSAGGSTSDDLDIGKLTHTMPQICNQCLQSYLVEINPEMEPIPELAESWEPSPDATKWIFRLRRAVEFHNAKTLDAEDVVYSINYHRGETKSAGKGLMGPVKDVKADGKYTVIFDLEEGNADFPVILSDHHIAIVPAGTNEKEFAKGIGTGPFKLKNYEPGVRFTAERNPNYFKENRPYFDELEILSISDVNARTNALKSGQIDVMNRCEVKTFDLMKKAPGLQALALNGAKHYSIPMLTTSKPYDNNDVRLGLKYGVDRTQLVKLLLRGYGYEGNDHPIAKVNRYYAHEIPIRAYDPDKAMFHMKKAGMTDHVFNLHAADAAFGGAVDAAILIKEKAAKAGINIKVVREPDDGYWSNVWMKKEWCMSYWMGRPSEDMMFSIAYAADANWNETLWKHERFNKLLKEARPVLDQTKRREKYVELQRICRDEGGALVPVFAQDLSAASDKLGHEETIGTNYEFDGLRLPERWWFKS